jgi:peptidylprolyl isomerase
MKVRWLVFASLLSIFAMNLESVTMSSAADKNAREPGPSDKDAEKQEFSETKSGLKYRVLRKTKGPKPTDRDTVKVNYKGWLDDGTVFDSSYSAGRSPAEFPLKAVIKGWTEGMQLVGEGGMIELEIPYEIAYGAAGRPPRIPPKATLHFIVELLEVVAAPEPIAPGKTDADAPKEFTTTKSGLKYRVLRNSEGKKPSASSTVEVHYKGWLDNGKEFDSSYERGETTSFPLDQVISGWTEGLQLIGKGGMIELELPSKLGYGDRGAPPDIPPKATLHFIVELINVR